MVIIDELMKYKIEALVYHGIMSYSQRINFGPILEVIQAIHSKTFNLDILTATCLDKIGVGDINKNIATAATCLVILVGGTALAPHPVERGSSPSHS